MPCRNTATTYRRLGLIYANAEMNMEMCPGSSFQAGGAQVRFTSKVLLLAHLPVTSYISFSASPPAAFQAKIRALSPPSFSNSLGHEAGQCWTK